MRIALDATPLTQTPGGVSRYTAELSTALARCFPDDEIWLLSDQPFEKPRCLAPNLKAGPGPANVLERRWWLWGLQSQLGRYRIDVFHGADFAVPYVPVRPSVLSLHDLSPWLEPKWHRAAKRVRSRTPKLLRTGLATLVLTPSEAIRREAISRFRLDPGRVAAVPHAASPLFRPGRPRRLASPYFLYVGALEPRKNLPLLIDAWRQVRERRQVDLVLIGRRREDCPEIPALPGLHLAGSVPDEELPAWYSGCLASVYPSLYEGFGLPLLEAMQCGAAVVTSKDSAIMETCGGAAIHIDAHDVSGWSQALADLIENPERVQDLRARSLRRAREFSWEKTAQQTREVYLEAVRRFRA